MPPDAQLITAGGWHPAYARVLVVAFSRDRAVALVDTNGDGVHVWVGHYWRDQTGAWFEAGGSGSEPSTVGSGNSQEYPDYVASWGRERPDVSLEVNLGAERITVRTNSLGWWAAIRPTS